MLKDTSVTAGIRTHILLLTPELESGKLDRSATTLHLLYYVALTLTTPNPPKILQGALLGKNPALLETGTFTSSKWGNITTWQEVQAISAEYERSTNMHGAF